MSGLAAARYRLDNRLTVLHARNPHSSAVTLSLSVAAGACLEPADRDGLATLAGRALTRGTARRDKRAIGEELDFRGALLVGSAGRHACSLTAKARVADFEPILDLLAECARDPVFPEAEVAKLRGDRITALREDEEDPATVAMLAFRERAYDAGHPYARRLRGTVDSVAAITAADLRAFHARHFDPAAALLLVVGDVDVEAAMAAAERAFADWRSRNTSAGYREAAPTIPDAEPLAAPVRAMRPLPDKAQVEIVLGHAGIRRADPRYYAAVVMNSILGSFAMGGRLGRVVREERGMAYHIGSSFAAGAGPGPFTVRAGVQPEHVEAAIAAVLAEVERIRREPVDAAELDDARAAIVRSLPRGLESNEGIAGVLHLIELYDLGLDYIERFPALMSAVTAGSVAAAAAELLNPDGYVVAAAGPGIEATAES